ncbi:RNA pseudouridine synthase 2 [Chlorella vulgaris]
MLRLMGATARATRGLERRSAAQLCNSRQSRPLHAAPTDLQGATQAESLQRRPPDHELVVSLTDFDLTKSKLRLDSFLAAKLPSASRARLQASIKGGLVAVNGRPQASRAALLAAKASHGVRPGDVVACCVLPPPPLEAAPEALPLDIVYEDEHLIVINKEADMVMHPSPGHYSGTLVNALLHHCQLPAMQLGTGAAAPLSLEGAAAAAATAAEASSSGSSSGSGGQHARQAAEAGVAAGSNGASATPHGAAETADATPSLVTHVQRGEQEVEEEEEEEGSSSFRLLGPASTSDGAVRPGIVHRLDKGTTGLLVVAKTDAAHMSLAQQARAREAGGACAGDITCSAAFSRSAALASLFFSHSPPPFLSLLPVLQFKDRTVRRTYVSVALGVPRPAEGRVATNVGRDLRDRKKMAAFAYASARGRTAASNYKLLEVLAGGGASLVQWRLETGRTHQIRVHAKHIGHALLADDTYSSAAAACSIVGAGKPPRAAAAQAAVKALARPALHAKSLGFVHPASGQLLEFDSELPPDLQQMLAVLRGPPFS